MPITIPPRLYKYEPFDTKSLENLKAQSIHFGPPSGFNDPYDCAFFPTIKIPSDLEIETIRQSMLRDPKTTNEKLLQYEKISIPDLRANLMRTCSNLFQEKINEFKTKRGVSCFSAINDNLLMWGHYGGKYKGFCLEFDTACANFNNFLEVTYSSKIPEFDLVRLFTSEDTDDMIYSLFTTKSEAWSYEKEWRAIHETANMCYRYPAESLTGVYFGPEISQEAAEIIFLVLVGQNDKVLFWRGHRSKTAFAVEFIKFI